MKKIEYAPLTELIENTLSLAFRHRAYFYTLSTELIFLDRPKIRFLRAYFKQYALFELIL